VKKDDERTFTPTRITRRPAATTSVPSARQDGQLFLDIRAFGQVAGEGDLLAARPGHPRLGHHLGVAAAAGDVGQPSGGPRREALQQRVEVRGGQLGDRRQTQLGELLRRLRPDAPQVTDRAPAHLRHPRLVGERGDAGRELLGEPCGDLRLMLVAADPHRTGQSGHPISIGLVWTRH